MIICLYCLSLIIYFVIIGIFFPSKRKFVKQAIKCFWMKVRGIYCSDSFDDLVHKRFVVWLAEHKQDKLANFFKEKKHFGTVLVFSTVIFTVINIALLFVLYRWLFIKSPCSEGEVCQVETLSI